MNNPGEGECCGQRRRVVLQSEGGGGRVGGSVGSVGEKLKAASLECAAEAKVVTGLKPVILGKGWSWRAGTRASTPRSFTNASSPATMRPGDVAATTASSMRFSQQKVRLPLNRPLNLHIPLRCLGFGQLPPVAPPLPPPHPLLPSPPPPPALHGAPRWRPPQSVISPRGGRAAAALPITIV